MRSRAVTPINLLCDQCENVQTIRRLVGRRHKPGHTKHMWCYICKQETAHTDTNCDYVHNMQTLILYNN